MFFFCRWELVDDHSELTTYLGKGDNRNARLHTKMVASRLNRLPSDSSAQPGLRPLIRERMLDALSGLPVRDEVGLSHLHMYQANYPLPGLALMHFRWGCACRFSSDTLGDPALELGLE